LTCSGSGGESANSRKPKRGTLWGPRGFVSLLAAGLAACALQGGGVADRPRKFKHKRSLNVWKRWLGPLDTGLQKHCRGASAALEGREAKKCCTI